MHAVHGKQCVTRTAQIRHVHDRLKTFATAKPANKPFAGRWNSV